VSIKIILRFNLDKSFPVGDSTTFEAMSHFSGLSIMNVHRIIRHAILNHWFFEEKSPGIITHSALTAVLAGDDMERNALVVKLDEFWPAGVMVHLIFSFENLKGLRTNGRVRQPMRWRNGRILKKAVKP
jgi:hypothetical protein